MVTIREVARQARVSVGTVSNVLAGSVSVRPELRRRVEEVMRALDYHPNEIARSLKTRQTKTLGMVISDITNPFYPQIVRGAEDAAMLHGYLLFILNTDENTERERRALSTLRTRKVDGLLLTVAPGREDLTHVAQFRDSGLPIVCIDRSVPGIDLDVVCADNAHGARMCIQHLLSRGHRRIGFLGGSPGVETAQLRLEGYEQTLREAGLPLDPKLVRHGDFRFDSGYRLSKEMLLEADAPTALFASNARMGFGALKAIHELGLRCPEDVALAVFDEVPFGDVIQPRLTVVAQPAYEMGRVGTELLIARLEAREKSPDPVHLTLTPELLVRDSTATRRS
ncbi:MAG: LacI family DNA-binding transcriptional regulator [Bryobacteraceae bacterium]|jgi:LacI family transcriptional regulator